MKAKSGTGKKLVKNFFKMFSLVILVGVIGVGAVGYWFVSQLTEGLPNVSALKTYQASHATIVYSEEGKKIGEFSNERRYPVEFEKIPKHVRNAFIAAEDSHFYQHGGIDFTSIARAAISNLSKGKFAQGASTITQQVARGLLLTKKKEITRKIREVFLARRMEKELTKDQILSLYLSDIYLGHGAYGIGAAAQSYFHKEVQDLTIGEAAILAGLPQRPNDWDPFHNPYESRRRQHYVLKRMLDEKYISAAEMKTALETPLTVYVLEDTTLLSAPYFTEYIRQYLMKKYGADKVLSDGLQVYTTVRYDLQKHAESVVNNGLRSVDKRLGWRGPILRVDSDKREEFLTIVHDDLIADLTPARILPPQIEPKTKKLNIDLTPFWKAGSGYFGETPIEVGKVYKGLIETVDEKNNSATGKIGKTVFQLDNKDAEWVREHQPDLKQLAKVVKPGDVVYVKVKEGNATTKEVTVSLEQDPEIQGALLSFDVDTGYVRSMVGGSDFSKNKFNIALQAKRQVGSTFKPIIYAAAMEKGFSPSSQVTDSPLIFKVEGADEKSEEMQVKDGKEKEGKDSWRPHNFSGKFEGDIPLRFALIRSMNVPTVKLLNELSIDYVINTARKMGITSTLNRDLSIALGSWSSSLDELARAYAIFPRQGQQVRLTYVKKVVDRDGKVLEEAEPSLVVANPTETPISPQTAFVMTDLLRGVVREGTGSGASGIPQAAGKTGTSNDHRDVWFMGFNPNIMTGVWLGYEKEKSLESSETGGKAAAPIWSQYMQKAIQIPGPLNDYVVPEGIVFAYIDKRTGKLASSNTEKRVKVAFREGTVPNAEANNLLRVNEPGARAATSSAETVLPQPTPQGDVPLPAPPASEATEDFLRQGYQ